MKIWLFYFALFVQYLSKTNDVVDNTIRINSLFYVELTI